MKTKVGELECGRSGSLIYVSIRGQYDRTVPVWEAWKIRADLSARLDINFRTRLIVYSQLEKLEASYQDEIESKQIDNRVFQNGIGELLVWSVLIAAILTFWGFVIFAFVN